MAKKDNAASMIVGYSILCVSSLLFLHSGMGVSQFKHWLLMHDEPTQQNTSLPVDIILECLIGLGLALFAINFFISRPFREIVNTSETKLKLMDGLTYSEDFTIFKRRKHPVPLKE
eukprot:38793_1